MENTFLPGTVRERIADLMKYHKVSQTDLALKIGYRDSLLSRFLTGKTDKLGDENNVSGIIDIDWIGFGDMLTFVALTRVSLLNMDLDTKYIDYLLDEIRPNTIEYYMIFYYFKCKN